MKKHLLLCLALAATTLSSQAQTAVSLTGTAPDASAMFDVSATDKGMLIPRVALSSTGASAPITSPLTSLLVYNTAGVADVTPGYYYWNGTTWQRLVNGNGTFPTGSGTLNTIPKWTPNGTTLGNSLMTDDGTTVTNAAQYDVTGGTGTSYITAPIEVRTTLTPRVAFHWPGVVASQIGMDASGVIRTYDNPGTSYEQFAASNITANGFFNTTTGYRIGNAAASGNYLRGNGTNFVSSAIQAGDLPAGSGNYIQNQNSSVQTANFIISGTGRADGDFRAPIFYDQNNTGYYVDPASTSITNDMRANIFYDQGNTGYYVDPASTSITNDMRANIFYDQGNTGYYVDPASTSELNLLTRGTLARHSLNALQDNSPVTTRAAQGDAYRNGSMGWGTTDFNVMTNWGSGFIDSWSSPGNAPGGSTHYTGIQSMHHTSQNSVNFYGWQMVTAGESVNRYFLRNSWNVPRPWVEMVHSGNYTSFGDNLGNHSATTTLTMNANNINSVNDIYATNNYGTGLVGVYSDTRYQNVWAMGTSWRLPADGTTPGNLYGLAWTHSNIGGQSIGGLSHQLLVMENGATKVALGTGVWTPYTSYFPFIYDQQNTGYYLDPNSTSQLYWLYDYYDRTYYDSYPAYNGGQEYVGWGWAYNYGYYCTYSCGWWNYSSCGTTCYDYYNKMQVNGRAYSYSWANFSDGRLKTNIGTISNALDMVKSMRGVTYDWKTNEATRAEAIKNADPVYISEPDKKAEKLQSQVGFIAQEIQNILPSAVSQIEEKDSTGAIIGTTLGVDYTSVIPVLVEAIKEQQKQIDELRALLGASTSGTPVQQTNYNTPPAGANSMSAGKTNSTNLSVKDAVKLLEDNLSFMTKEHQEQMKDFINEIKKSDKLNSEQLNKVLEFRNNIKEFQKNNQ